ncbi:hypothetical protein A2U01_0062026, partial [Trifolium medium]|nr:hypothetical protein [Trifolium medium]
RPPRKPPDKGTPLPPVPPSPSSPFNSQRSRPPPKPLPSSFLFCENAFEVLALKSTSKIISAPLDLCIVILGKSHPSKETTIHVLCQLPIMNCHVVFLIPYSWCNFHVLAVCAS